MSSIKVDKSDLAVIIFGVYTSGDIMERLCNDNVIADDVYKGKDIKHLHLLTNSLRVHGIETLNELYGTQLELVQGFN